MATMKKNKTIQELKSLAIEIEAEIKNLDNDAMLCAEKHKYLTAAGWEQQATGLCIAQNRIAKRIKALER